MDRAGILIGALSALVFVAAAQTARVERAVVLYADRAVAIERTLAPTDPNELWVTPADLKRINGFELKPQGACIDELCIPIARSGPGSLVRVQNRQKWFHLTGFARKIGQAVVSEPASRVWSFGEIPVVRGSFHSGIAPDFTLPDRRGKVIRLADFRGRKVLLLAWASW